MRSAHAIAVTNGTAALHLICLAAGLGPGDEVIVPSLTFVATANAIGYTGATPVFADIAGLERPGSLPMTVATAIGTKTRAIMTMAYGGHPGESAALAELPPSRGLMLLEDAAHGLGGSLAAASWAPSVSPGRSASSRTRTSRWARAGWWSRTTTSSPPSAAPALHGMTTLTWDRHRGHASGYDVVELGFNYRIDEPRATLATERLARLDAENRRRAAAAGVYRERLGDDDGARPALPAVDNGSVGEPPVHRGAVRGGSTGTPCGRASPSAGSRRASTIRPFTASRPTGRGRAPGHRRVRARAVTLPLFPTISEEQIGLVVDSLEEAFDRSLRN